MTALFETRTEIQSTDISKAEKHNKEILYMISVIYMYAVHNYSSCIHSSSLSISSYRPIFQVDFISYNNKWEIFWVPGTGLD